MQKRRGLRSLWCAGSNPDDGDESDPSPRVTYRHSAEVNENEYRFTDYPDQSSDLYSISDHPRISDSPEICLPRRSLSDSPRFCTSDRHGFCQPECVCEPNYNDCDQRFCDCGLSDDHESSISGALLDCERRRRPRIQPRRIAQNALPLLQVVPSTPTVYSPTDGENSPKNFEFPEISQKVETCSSIKKEPKKQISSSSSSSENSPPSTTSPKITTGTTDQDLSDSDLTLKDDPPNFTIATDSDSQTVTETKDDETIIDQIESKPPTLPKVSSDVHLTRVSATIKPLPKVTSAGDLPKDIRIDIAPDEGLIFNHDSGIESVEVSPCPVTENSVVFAAKFETAPEIHEPKKSVLKTTSSNHKQKLLLHPDRAKFVPEQSSIDSVDSNEGKTRVYTPKITRIINRCRTSPKQSPPSPTSSTTSSVVSIKNIDSLPMSSRFHKISRSHNNLPMPQYHEDLYVNTNPDKYHYYYDSSATNYMYYTPPVNSVDRYGTQYCAGTQAGPGGTQYSLLDALDLSIEDPARRTSFTNVSLHKLTFTQSLAFPALARGLASKHGGSFDRAIRRTQNTESNLSACIKLCTTFVLVCLSMLVFALVYKFVRT